MAEPARQARRSKWPIVILVLAGVGFALWFLFSASPPEEREAPTFPLPEYSETHYHNVGADAHFIGSEACAKCHRANHGSYLMTAHSRALSELDPAAEPPDGAFDHKASGRSYRVYREGGKFRHEETLRNEKGDLIARVDLPIKYLIGSGNFCRTYLAEVDGFLHESPVTWYTAKKKWDMSPGYDFPKHHSFERPVTWGCLKCHSGRVEPAAGAVNRMTIHENAIGCERCHGPGSLHAEHQRTGPKMAGDDRSIVNPAKLSRPLLESICADCHLNGPAVVMLRGRGPTDFRPGRPLTDYRIDYRYESGTEQMTVVGHMEQLRRSVCYQKAENLSCVTCHDPHAREQPKDSVALFRQRCVDCHSSDRSKQCSADVSERTRKAPGDNCMTCHMPSGDTDIPHLSFTHHRIGRHGVSDVAKPGVPNLVPTHNDSHLSAIDRKRNLGLAYFQAAANTLHTEYIEAFRDRAKDNLKSVHGAGLRDGAVSRALAELHWKEDLKVTRRYANDALESPGLSSEDQAICWMLLATCDFEERNYTSAIQRLEELVKRRRFAEDWRLLGVSYLLDNQPRQALRAFEGGLLIRPSKPDIHGGMYEVYRRLGDQQKAQDCLERAHWLEKHNQE